MPWPKAVFAVRVSLFFAATVFGLTASATIYTVLPDGTGDFPTIQAAIDACVDGDIVELGDGTFTGDGNRDLRYQGRAITVRSQTGDPEVCVIDSEGSAQHPHWGISFGDNEGPASVLEHITITGGYVPLGGMWSGRGAGIFCSYGASPTIRGCVLEANSAEMKGGGMVCQPSSSPTIVDCVFRDNNAGEGAGLSCENASPTVTSSTFILNSAGGHGGGMLCESASHAEITNCTFAFNEGGILSPGPCGGIFCRSYADPIVVNTIIAFSTRGEAVYCQSGAVVTLVCCDVYGNAGGDWVGCIAEQLGTNGNICEDPLFCGDQNPSKPYTLHSDSPCAPDSNPECGLIGAWGAGCGVSAVEYGSWGSIKAMFR